MAFRNQLDNNSGVNAGMGQRFLPDQLSWNSQYGLGRKTTGGELSPGSRKNMGVGMPPQPQPPPPTQQQAPSQQKPRKTGLFGEDEDNETSLYFPPTSMFRADREMMSNSPSGGLTSSSQLAAGLMANTQLAGLMANASFSGNSQLTGSLGLTGNSQSSGLGGNSQLSGGLSVSSQLNQLTSGLTGNLQLSGNSQVPGSSQSSVSFGTSQNSVGFGTSQNSVGFGTSQNSGGFGSSQNSSGFGSSQPSGGFGSSQNSIGFGTSQPSVGFGSSQNSSAFGSSQPASSSFGTSQSASAFGNSQAGSATFGTTAPSSGFGNSSTSSGFGNSQLSGGLQGSSQSSSTFGNNFYTPGLGNLANFQQRGGITGPQFRGNNATPTSMNPNFPLNLQTPQQPSPNRNIMSAIGGQRINQNLQNLQKRSVGSNLPGSNPPLNSMNNSYMFGQSSRQIFGNDDSQPSLDLSEFPTLGNRSSLQSSNPVPSNRNYVGMVSKPATESTPEFQIQQEDFPALPGAQNPPTSSTTDSARKTPTSTAQGIFDQALTKDGKFPGDKTGQTKRGIQTHPDGCSTFDGKT
ncbi:hypothetical protein KUTeg_006914 [Tegillarca granosa]|uniref:Uncharacterized protein n=1 Tax=Tegillarca granosa TaxID=220873 RepID=A0ABQ9FBQ3_TEGGR|nr:hypothetical protein KUTeg_006914 [Tegillarca granosa]